jgi:hypothetical protein
VFCAFLLNYVSLQPGEAIFLGAGEPHAYVSGGTFPEPVYSRLPLKSAQSAWNAWLTRITLSVLG